MIDKISKLLTSASVKDFEKELMAGAEVCTGAFYLQEHLKGESNCCKYCSDYRQREMIRKHPK